MLPFRARARRAWPALRALPRLAWNARSAPSFAEGPPPPLVTVVIATYNWSSVLRFAVASALRQTYPRVEVVVVGDGCTDDSEAVVASFDDPRVRWHGLPANSGSQSAPNNAGVELARGDYVAYHGHDDVWLPTHLAAVMSALLREGADVGHSVAEVVGPPGSRYRALAGLAHPAGHPDADSIPPTAIVHRRDVVASTGPWRDYRTITVAPDVEFVRSARAAGKRFVCTDALTVFKFNSAHRRNSYVERPSHEQERYFRASGRGRRFVYRELAAVALAQARSLFGSIAGDLPRLPPPPDPLPPGWHVTQYRRIRGLEPE